MKESFRLPVFLVPALMVFSILGLIGAASYAFRFIDPPQTATPTQRPPTRTPLPTLTPTLTATTTATRTLPPRPTWTERPRSTSTVTVTPTPTQTPTRTLIPILGAAKPFKYNDVYSLSPWSDSEADEAARMMRDIPDNTYKPAERISTAYNESYEYAVFAYREALLRYPDSLMVEKWQWGLAYCLARMGYAEAEPLYRSLMEQGLSKKSLRVEDLPEWFHRYEPNADLKLYALPSRPGFLSHYLVEFQEGWMYWWLVEAPGEIHLYPLNTFQNYAQAVRAAWLVTDLTGDGVEEFVLYQPARPEEASLGVPRVFDLSARPPVELPVSPSKDTSDYQMLIEISLQAGEESGSFNLNARVYPACPVDITRQYRWDGKIFMPEAPVFRIATRADVLPYCQTILDHATQTWEADIQRAMLEQLLPVWPPKLDARGRPFPADALDQLRLSLAMQQALTGDSAAASLTLEQLIASPAVPTSEWVSLAQKFQFIYQNGANLYLACREIPTCNLRNALRQVIATADVNDPVGAQQALMEAGVAIRSAGIFDFNQDGRNERWVTLRQREGEKLEYWILAGSPEGANALLVSYVDVDRPEPFYYSEKVDDKTVFQLEYDWGYLLDQDATGKYLLRATLAPIPLTGYTLNAMTEAQQALLAGVEAAQVIPPLEMVLTSDRFNCKTQAICGKFYYVLGLAYELAGQERQAIDTYIKLWWEESKNPFTTIARLKLMIRPTPTRTPTLTRTAVPSATPTPYRSPTPTATQTITATIDPNATATYTPTATPTATLTLTPSTTPTPSATPPPSITPTATETSEAYPYASPYPTVTSEAYP